MKERFCYEGMYDDIIDYTIIHSVLNSENVEFVKWWLEQYDEKLFKYFADKILADSSYPIEVVKEWIKTKI